MFQQHHGESLSEAWTRFKDLLQKVPHHGLDLWLQIQIFYDHVDDTTQMGINYAAGGRLRKLRPNEAWATIEKLAQYKDEEWNNTFIPDEVSFNYKNPDIEQLLGIMELKDFLTRHIFLRCDSSGDLYLVTSPSPTPHALLSMSPIGTVKPNPHFHGHTSLISLISPIPKSTSVALSDLNWRDAMYDEYNALIKKSTWVLVPKPPNVNVPIHQLDVKNAFLNGDLFETVYMYQPPGFCRCSVSSSCVSITEIFIRIKTSTSCLVSTFCELCEHGWFLVKSLCSSLFIYQHGSEVAYLLIYVDDIALTTSSTNLLQRIISFLHKEFDMTDLGALNYFLGISVTRDSTGMFLSQKKYALELLDRDHMANCNPTRTPVDTESKLGSDGDPISDPTLYRSLAAALKRVLRYVRGTLDFGLQLYASIIGSLVAHTDADWAGCPTTRWSTSGYCVFLGDNLLSWSAKRQHTLSRLSAEAEYY
ncbi:ribonuclease H-like domain-containing protein [Tanacetum coccineum]|uniref:Ribonuclease H-like domain-containing protein n=1 Tax=Tanacetum coccineum TaxID=301880 RepID=A0ABQ5AJP0_9ASTR